MTSLCILLSAKKMTLKKTAGFVLRRTAYDVVPGEGRGMRKWDAGAVQSITNQCARSTYSIFLPSVLPNNTESRTFNCHKSNQLPFRQQFHLPKHPPKVAEAWDSDGDLANRNVPSSSGANLCQVYYLFFLVLVCIRLGTLQLLRCFTASFCSGISSWSQLWGMHPMLKLATPGAVAGSGR